MRDLITSQVNRYRLTDRAALAHYGGWAGDELCGAFIVPSPIDGAVLCVLASSGEGWDHVSVSRKNRCPNWAEMCHVKDLFFLPTECVMQLHVPASDHVNNHPYCLHLWRPIDCGEMPFPSDGLVGVKGLRLF